MARRHYRAKHRRPRQVPARPLALLAVLLIGASGSAAASIAPQTSAAERHSGWFGLAPLPRHLTTHPHGSRWSAPLPSAASRASSTGSATGAPSSPSPSLVHGRSTRTQQVTRGSARPPLSPAPPTSVTGATAGNGGSPIGSPTTGDSPLRNCLPHPSACGYPDGTNTGVPPGTALRVSGSLTLSTPGQVVTGLDVRGSIVVTASNVVIKNSRVRDVDNDAAIIVRGNVHGVIISHVEIDGGKQTPSVVGISGSGFTADAVNIHGTADGIDAGDNVVVQNSWIHDLWVAPGDHTDGVQTAGGSNLLIVHDTIDATGAPTNSAVIMGADLGDLSNTQLRDCLLDGGTYTVYAGADPGNSSGIITIANNRYGDHAQYGPNSFRASPDGAIVFTGNVWDASGAPLRE